MVLNKIITIFAKDNNNVKFNKQIPMKSNAQTRIPFTPRAYKVILEATFEVSVLNLFNKDVLSDLQPTHIKVAAIGEGIHDLEINDEVAILSSKDLYLLDFKWNNQSMKVKQNIHNEGKAIIGTGSVKTKEYYITDANNIIGVHDNVNDAN